MISFNELLNFSDKNYDIYIEISDKEYLKINTNEKISKEKVDKPLYINYSEELTMPMKKGLISIYRGRSSIILHKDEYNQEDLNKLLILRKLNKGD